MAEIIGILSNAITFVEFGNKVLTFFSTLHHVPERIATHRQQLENMLHLIERVKMDFDRLSNGTGTIPVSVIPQADLDTINDLLQKAMEQIQHLHGMLDCFVIGPHDGRIKRTEKALRAVKKQEQIGEKFSRLQNLHSSIERMLNYQVFLLAKNQISLEQETHLQLQQIEAQLDSTHLSITSDLFSVDRSVKRAIEKSETAITRQIERLSLSQSNEIQQKLNLLSAQMDRHVALTTPVSQKIESGSNRRAYPLPLNGKEITKISICTCKTRPAPYYLHMGSFLFQSRTKEVHENDCPLRRRSTRELIFGIRLASVQFALSARFGSAGLGIGTNIKLPAKIVDAEDSKAFSLFKSLQEDYYLATKANGHRPMYMKRFCEQLTQGLATLFRKGLASADDQTEDGRTLLTDFIYFAHDHTRTSLIENADSVVTCLVQHGADINCHSNQRSIGRLTPMDIIILRGVTIIASSLNPLDGPPLESILTKHGGEVQAVPSQLLRYTFMTIRSCAGNPDLVFDLGFPPYYRPIFEKNSQELSKLIRKEHNWNEWDHKFPSPVECAVTWTKGLEMLLDAGADATLAWSSASRFNVTEVIKLLLSREFPAFWSTKNGESTIMPQEYTWLPETRILVVNHIKSSRNKLAQIGRECLPKGIWERKHLEKIALDKRELDEFALDIWLALEKRGFELPDSLWPGTRKSVYHWIDPHFDDEEPSRLFFESGFSNLEIPDKDGMTPLARACKRCQLRLAKFYHDRGAKLQEACLWELATGKAALHGVEGTLFLEWISSGFSYIPCDNCVCYCCSSGCIPLTVSIRNLTSGWLVRRRHAVEWVSAMQERQQEECYSEVCRLDIFERLSMTHTCCRPKSRNSYIPYGRNDWAALNTEDCHDIQEEEGELASILEQYMELFGNLWSAFNGPLQDFLDAWWTALDVFLPHQGFETTPGAGFCAGITSLPVHTAEPTGDDWIDSKGITVVVENYHGLLTFVSCFVEADAKAGFAEDVVKYLQSLGVPEKFIQWIQKQTPNNNISYPTFLRASRREGGLGFLEYLAKNLSYSEPLEHYMGRTITPLVTAAIIRDLEAGSEIPATIRGFLESEGIVRNGKLCCMVDGLDPEEIFQQSLHYLYFS